MPKAAARAHILRKEGDTRSFYTGYLGPVGLNGKTSLFVNLRSARYARDTLYLHVGGGIVAGSDPAQEWQETVEKTRTIAKAL
jgi:isochorismate synthase